MSFRTGFEKQAAEKKKEGVGERVGTFGGYLGGLYHSVPSMFDDRAVDAISKDMNSGMSHGKVVARGVGRSLLRAAPYAIGGTLAGKYVGRGVDKLIHKKKEA